MTESATQHAYRNIRSALCGFIPHLTPDGQREVMTLVESWLTDRRVFLSEQQADAEWAAKVKANARGDR